MMLNHIFFHVIAALLTLCSLCVILSRNPVTSAIFLVIDFFCLAMLYASLNAHFVATIQILVYAGAIMVLFLFVIMLLNLPVTNMRKFNFHPFEAVCLLIITVGLGALIIYFLTQGLQTPATNFMQSPDSLEAQKGNTYALAMQLFTGYLWPFELASILILLAVVASIVIAKKKVTDKS